VVDPGEVQRNAPARRDGAAGFPGDLADFFRRALEDESARGRYVIGNGINPAPAEMQITGIG
jgi:hypothetical protein